MDSTAHDDPEMSISYSEDTSPLNTVTQRVHKDAAKQANQEDFQAFQLEMRKLMNHFIATQKAELTELNFTMKEIQETNKSIEFSIKELTEQNKEFQHRIEQLEITAKEDRAYIMFLEDKLEDLQLGNRKTNFEIKGVPRKETETKKDLVEMVITLSENIDCKITKSDIKDIYRVKSKKPEHKNTPIVVETCSSLLKNDFLKMAKAFNIKHKTKICAKHLGFKTQEDTPVFISENLTSKASRLYYLARDLARSKSYKYVWTAYGKVYIRKNEQSPIIMINTEQQVQNLLQQD
ncbi:hypothetical protein NE865_16491 [Phthorimaea operculella]|nr:hypothetical protein NE865_16491 [Phthorimaea operculella]